MTPTPGHMPCRESNRRPRLLRCMGRCPSSGATPAPGGQPAAPKVGFGNNAALGRWGWTSASRAHSGDGTPTSAIVESLLPRTFASSRRPSRWGGCWRPLTCTRACLSVGLPALCPGQPESCRRCPLSCRMRCRWGLCDIEVPAPSSPCVSQGPPRSHLLPGALSGLQTLVGELGSSAFHVVESHPQAGRLQRKS